MGFRGQGNRAMVLEVLWIQLFVNRWRIWIKTYTGTSIVARRSWCQRSRLVSDGHGSLMDSIIRELLKGFEQKTYPNACRSVEMKWLRFQGDGLRGQGHRNVCRWGIQSGSLSHRHLVKISSHRYLCYLCRICHFMPTKLSNLLPAVLLPVSIWLYFAVFSLSQALTSYTYVTLFMLLI